MTVVLTYAPSPAVGTNCGGLLMAVAVVPMCSGTVGAPLTKLRVPWDNETAGILYDLQKSNPFHLVSKYIVKTRGASSQQLQQEVISIQYKTTSYVLFSSTFEDIDMQS